MRGEKKWKPDRTSSTPEGWLGGRKGSHAWRDPQGLRGSGVSIPRGEPIGQGRPVGLPGRVLHPPRPLPGRVGPRDIGGRRWGRRGEADGEGISGIRGSGGTHLVFTPLTQAQ